MGSFNATCGVSGMTIGWGDECVLIPLKKPQFEDAYGMDFDSKFEAAAFPMTGKYDDYGYFTDLSTNPGNRYFTDGEWNDGQKGTFFAMHKKVADLMFGSILEIDDYYGPLKEKGITGLKEEIAKAKEKAVLWSQRTFFNLTFAHDLELVSRHLPTRMQMYEVVDSVEKFDEFFSDDMVEEMYRYTLFAINMNYMHKVMEPTKYAGQCERIDSYRALAKVMLEVADDQERQYDDE